MRPTAPQRPTATTPKRPIGQQPALTAAKPYTPPSTIMAPERDTPRAAKPTTHHDPVHLLGRLERWRGAALGGLVGMGLGIMLTLYVVNSNTQTQTAATVEAFGQGVATGTAMPTQDAANYGDDFGHQKTKKPYREPR